VASPAPCLLVLRSQLDAAYPRRSRASDGIMGDPAHRLRKSDHNQGNAIDVTHSPPVFSAAQLAEAFRRQMRTAGPDGRLSYIIWNRQIASPRGNWIWRPYTEQNPHTSHVHLSIKPTHRNVTRPWKLK